MEENENQNQANIDQMVDETKRKFNSYYSKNLTEITDMIDGLRFSLKNKLEGSLDIRDQASYMRVESIIDELINKIRSNIIDQKEGLYNSMERNLEGYMYVGSDNGFEDKMSKFYSHLEDGITYGNRGLTDVLSRIADDSKLQFNNMVDPGRNGRCDDEKRTFSRTIEEDVIANFINKIREMDKELINQTHEMLDQRLEEYKSQIQEKDGQEKDEMENDTREKSDKDKFRDELKLSTYSDEEIEKRQEEREQNEKEVQEIEADRTEGNESPKLNYFIE